MWHPASRYDLVRCGIALYGLAPAADGIDRGPASRLRPAMSPQSPGVLRQGARRRASACRTGCATAPSSDSVVATVPLGYADGVTRSLAAAGGQVLIGGQRRPIAGTVTMDQIIVDCGPDADGGRRRRGGPARPPGRRGDLRLGVGRADGTIAYEVVCGISGRVPRVYRA